MLLCLTIEWLPITNTQAPSIITSSWWNNCDKRDGIYEGWERERERVLLGPLLPFTMYLVSVMSKSAMTCRERGSRKVGGGEAEKQRHRCAVSLIRRDENLLYGPGAWRSHRHGGRCYGPWTGGWRGRGWSCHSLPWPSAASLSSSVSTYILIWRINRNWYCCYYCNIKLVLVLVLV